MNRNVQICLVFVMSVFGCTPPQPPSIKAKKVILVNYEKTLESAVVDARFDSVNPDVTSKNFKDAPHENGKRELTVAIFTFGRKMESGEVIEAMQKAGYRPATLRELLAYGMKNPKEQLTTYYIVALGSRSPKSSGRHNISRVAVLNHGGEMGLDRILSLMKGNSELGGHDDQMIWSQAANFLAVHL